MYTVTISNAFRGLKFKFYTIDEAMTFVGMAIERGEYTNSDGEIENVTATIEFEEVPVYG